MIYVDTSVLSAYYCPEPLSQQAQDFLRSSSEPAISLLTEVELASAVSRKVRERELERTDAARIVETFSRHMEEGRYARLPVNAEHFRAARGWIADFSSSLRTLDALHLAVAASARRILLTSDTRLAECAQHFGVGCRLVRAGRH